jgi:hypothetical protein
MTALCTTSEVSLTTDFEEKDFYVFCDAIKRSVVTGAKMSIETTSSNDRSTPSSLYLIVPLGKFEIGSDKSAANK